LFRAVDESYTVDGFEFKKG
jgi:cytochrome P450